MGDTRVIPDYLINILIERLTLKFDRDILCQILKIQAFINYGTWQEDLKEMQEAISHVNDFSQQ